MNKIQHISTNGCWFVMIHSGKCSDVFSYNINTKNYSKISTHGYAEYIAICEINNVFAIAYRGNTIEIYNCIDLELLHTWKILSDPADLSFDKKGNVICHFWKSYHSYSIRGEILRKVTHKGDFQSATKSGYFLENNQKAYFHDYENGDKKVGNVEVVGDACETEKYRIVRQFRGDIIVLDHSSKLIKKIKIPITYAVMTLGCFEERFVCAYIYDIEDTNFYRLWKYDIITNEFELIKIPDVGLTVFNNMNGVMLTADLQIISLNGTVEGIKH